MVRSLCTAERYGSRHLSPAPLEVVAHLQLLRKQGLGGESLGRRKPVRETTAIRVRTPACFDVGGNTVTGRVTVATVHQHGAAVPKLNQASKDSSHGLENVKGWSFSGSGSSGQGRQNLLISAALKTAPPDDELKSNLRVKRSDPSFRANVPPQAVAVLERNGADAEPIIRRRVWTQLGERAAGRRPPNPAERPHSIIPYG